MPRDLTPIEQRPTQHLQLRFDRLCSNSIVADAIEAFAIMQELSRRAIIAQRSVPANEGIGGSNLIAPVPSPSSETAANTGGDDGAAG